MGCQLSRLARRGPSSQYAVPGNTEQQPELEPRTCGAAAAHATQPTNTAASSASQPAKKKLDPQDFMYSGLQSVTRVKLPGAVQGEQFVIDNCKDCTLLVLDHCAAVTIDDCTNCRILIGPTESSVFMRDCSNCTLAAITRQLRCRDCTDCSLLLLCRTRPIIESSCSMAFGCYDAPYAGLAAQMAAAKLNPLHNFWSDVYDFTPAGGGAAAAAGSAAVDPAAKPAQQHQTDRKNWRLLPEAVSVQQMLGGPALPDEVLALLGSTAGTAGTAAVCAGARAACSCLEPAGKPQEQEQLSTSGSSSSTTGGVVVVASSAGVASSCMPAVPHVDQMCVICSMGQRQPARACGSSSRHLFALFPAGQHAAALEWVHSSITKQQQQEQEQHQQGQQGAQEDRLAAGEPCLAAAADPADIQLSCSSTADPMQDPAACGVAAATASAAAAVLHTNEASIPAPVLQQMAAAAGWNKQQLKTLGASTPGGKGKGSSLVGLEVLCGCEATEQWLRAAAEAAGALCCANAASAAAAQLFRDLGMDG